MAQAGTLPAPRSAEWWFTAWDIENQVWQQGQGDGETVAVLDSGVNAELPELQGVVLPGGDSRHGYNTDGRTDIEAEHYDLEPPGTPPHDGHGTEMAALIASQGGPTGLWVSHRR